MCRRGGEKETHKQSAVGNNINALGFQLLPLTLLLSAICLKCKQSACGAAIFCPLTDAPAPFWLPPPAHHVHVAALVEVHLASPRPMLSPERGVGRVPPSPPPAFPRTIQVQ